MGAGASAVVLKGRYADGLVAVKRLQTLPSAAASGSEFEDSVKLFFTQEASLLSRLNHPNVVRFFGVSYEEGHFFIVTEFCPSNLLKVLQASKRQAVPIHEDHVLGLALSVRLNLQKR